jgi:hypothetical protein
MLTAPDDGLGVVVFGNTSSMGPHVIANTIMAHLLGVPDPVTDLPRTDVLDTPHLWSELCGFYGPKKGFNTNLRIWMGLAGEIEVLVQDNQLTARALVGPLRKGIPLYRVDPDDPLVFRTSFEDLPHWVAFGRNAAGEVDRASLVGFVYATLYKRPPMESLRYRTLGLLGALGGLAVFALGRRRRVKR